LRLAARAACALACLALAACATSEGPPFRPIAGEEDALHARFAAATRDAEARQALRATGKLRVKSKDGTVSVQEVVLVQRPARMRLESLNVLGQAQSVFILDDDLFRFFDGQRVEDGDTKADTLRERLGLTLEPSEAIRALLAEPLASDWPPREILGRGDERELRGATQSVRFAAGGELSRLSALDARGQVRWQAEYDEWRDVPGGRYPFSLVLSFPETSLRAELELTQVELNPKLDPALFTVARRDPAR